MKHTAFVTALLILTFVAAQLFGLFLVSKEAVVTTSIEGNTSVIYGTTAIGDRPQTTGLGSFLYVAIGVGIGTLLLLLLMRYNKTSIWKAWFFAAVALSITVALGVFISSLLALACALVLASWKLWRPNVLIHNVTEVLMYGGIAVLFVPLFGVLWAVILLIAISLYDAYAVWRSKHMVSMATFQTKSNVFAGLYIPYTLKDDASANKTITSKITSSVHAGKRVPVASSMTKNPAVQENKGKNKTAILGGGDIAFPLIFTGAVFTDLLAKGFPKEQAFLFATMVIAATTIALTLLFFFAKKDRFYPAMPFISAGCFVGYGLLLLFI